MCLFLGMCTMTSKSLYDLPLTQALMPIAVCGIKRSTRHWWLPGCAAQGSEEDPVRDAVKSLSLCFVGWLQVSEQDLSEMQTEFQQRLSAADRRVYALTKERDALKRDSERLSEVNALIREKDDIIKQVSALGNGRRVCCTQSWKQRMHCYTQSCTYVSF